MHVELRQRLAAFRRELLLTTIPYVLLAALIISMFGCKSRAPMAADAFPRRTTYFVSLDLTNGNVNWRRVVPFSVLAKVCVSGQTIRLDEPRQNESQSGS